MPDAPDEGCLDMSGRTVAFLDIDGVLNSRDYEKHRRRIQRPSPHSLDAVAIARLNRFLTASHADIVVSSTWRLGGKCDTELAAVARMRGILSLHGVIGRVIGVTPELREDLPSGISVAQPRGLEIKAWLDAHPGIARFVIFDDDSSDSMAPFGHRHVQTDRQWGLTDADVDRAIVLLAESHAQSS